MSMVKPASFHLDAHHVQLQCQCPSASVCVHHYFRIKLLRECEQSIEVYLIYTALSGHQMCAE